MLTAAPGGDDGFLGTPYVAANFKYEHLNLRGQGWEFEHEPIPKLHMGGGPRVLKAAIVSMFNAAEGALRGTGLEWDDVDYVEAPVALIETPPRSSSTSWDPIDELHATRSES